VAISELQKFVSSEAQQSHKEPQAYRNGRRTLDNDWLVVTAFINMTVRANESLSTGRPLSYPRSLHFYLQAIIIMLSITNFSNRCPQNDPSNWKLSDLEEAWGHNRRCIPSWATHPLAQFLTQTTVHPAVNDQLWIRDPFVSFCLILAHSWTHGGYQPIKEPESYQDS